MNPLAAVQAALAGTGERFSADVAAGLGLGHSLCLGRRFGTDASAH